MTTTTIAPERFELVVAGGLAECEDVDIRTCMVVLRPGSDTWGNFYDAIEGFEFVDGTRSTLLVEQTIIPEPGADQGTYDYRLIEVLATEPDPDPPAPGDAP